MSHPTRRSGVLVPLFSFPSSSSWGIGDIGDVKTMTAWLRTAGQRVLQLLPLNEMASGQQSPYSAMTAMAIDPIFIRVTDIPEFADTGGEAALTAADRDDLARARAAPHIDYGTVRALKQRVMLSAFERFVDVEWRHQTARAQDLKTFLAAEWWWIADYALFRALHEREDHRPWTEWPTALQQRDPAALDAARQELAREVLFRGFLQWIADTQWQAARAAARENGVALFGDLPFMVDGNSADVWANQDQFRLDESVGVPPDAFSATGQDWGMPAYRWDAIAGTDFRWLRDRARRSAALFDGYRVDHLVGFYRTYSRPHGGGEPSFSPSEESHQLALGETLLQIFGGSGAEIIAEDLGTVPDFVRESLARLDVPGFRVFRWERHWHLERQPFRDPADYPPLSVAASGTHDTEPLITWWEAAPEDERRQVCDIRTVQHMSQGAELVHVPFNPHVRDALLETLFASGSALLLLPIQDVFGWRDRINEPATVTPLNWTFRLPWPCDALDDNPEAQERSHMLRGWSGRYGRL